MNLFQAIFNQDSLDRTAILYERRRISYAELREQTLAVAGALRTLEIEPGDRVALLLNDSPEFATAFIAICSYGAIAVPINMAPRLDEQRAILSDCTASVAIVEADLSRLLLADVGDKLPQLKQILLVRHELECSSDDTDEHGEENVVNNGLRVWSFGKLMKKANVPDNFPEAPFAEPSDNQPAFILYTSGSTGEPKGAVHRQSDIFYTNETYCREVLQLRDGDRLFSSSRLPFAYGLGNAFTFPLLNGCTTILCREKPSPEVIARVFAECQPTIFSRCL